MRILYNILTIITTGLALPLSGQVNSIDTVFIKKNKSKKPINFLHKMSNKLFLKYYLTFPATAILLCSCKYINDSATLRIRLECSPSTLFDSLSNVLLSNSYSDLGGKKNRRDVSFFSSETVYVKNLKRRTDSCYYLQDIEKSTYEYIYIEGIVNNTPFSAFKRNLDFSETPGDTAEITLCFKMN